MNQLIQRAGIANALLFRTKMLFYVLIFNIWKKTSLCWTFVNFFLQNMVKSFRVSDLQTLLASMGRSKSGLKQDLVGRALRLVQTEYSPELLKNVRQLYESRFPKTSGWLAARRPEGIYSTLSSSPTANSQGADYLNGISKPISTPAPEVKLVPLPFYQTLETLLPPTELSESIQSLFEAILKN